MRERKKIDGIKCAMLENLQVSTQRSKLPSGIKLIQTGHVSQTGANSYWLLHCYQKKAMANQGKRMHCKHFYDFIQFQFCYETFCQTNLKIGDPVIVWHS